MATRSKPQEIDYSRLCVAIQRGRRGLEFARQQRVDAVRQFVGMHYSEGGSAKEQPVNLLSLYVTIVGRNLIPKSPRVMLSTFERQLKPTIAAMERWINREIERSHLADTLREVVVDALFSVGICKVALATPAESAGSGWGMVAGEPFVDRVDLDDFVFDIHARNFRQASFMGHRYRVPLEVVRDDSKNYDKSRKDLVASLDQPFNQEGDERLAMLGRSNQGFDSEEFEEMVDLWEIYLPRHRLIVTLADQFLIGPAAAGGGPNQKPLRVQKWVGPDDGPYHILGYGTVPGNPMPKAPIQDLRAMNEAANATYRKVMRTVDRIKEVTAAQGTDMEDAERINAASDGDTVAIRKLEALKNVVFNGQGMQNVLLAAGEWKQLFSWLAGNLDMMGGLSPQSKTLGQDKMLSENASRAISDMQDQTVAYTADVLGKKGLGWFWWNDPFKTMTAKHRLPGIPEFEIAQHATPQDRAKGKLADLEMEVDPYSMQRQTPQTRMAAINQVVQGTILPMMTLMVQQGTTFDINAYLVKIAKYMDMPDLAEIITITEPPDEDSKMPGDEGPKMPAQTERTYTRENIPMRSEQGHRQDLMGRLMGQNLGGSPDTAKNGPPAAAKWGAR